MTQEQTHIPSRICKETGFIICVIFNHWDQIEETGGHVILQEQHHLCYVMVNLGAQITLCPSGAGRRRLNAPKKTELLHL
jgi:hypothetical protein